MSLSESGLLAQGIMPGPMIYGPKGKRITVRPKKGPAPSGRVRSGKGTVNFYARPKSSRGRRR